MDALTRLQERTWPAEGPARVPFWAYSDPDVYQREQDRIFGGPNWSYVALECEIPNPCDFVRSTIGEKPIVVTRDANGSVNVFANHCAHRGVVFCRHARGNARTFTCPYHQWTYDSTGMLIGMPFRRGHKGKGGLDPASGCRSTARRRSRSRCATARSSPRSTTRRRRSRSTSGRPCSAIMIACSTAAT